VDYYKRSTLENFLEGQREGTVNHYVDQIKEEHGIVEKECEEVKG